MKGRRLFVACKVLALVACVAIACSLASMAPASFAMGDAGEGPSLQAGGAASGETADSALLTTALETQVSKSDYTLYSNGTLVIHNNLRGLLESTQLFNESDPEWDIDLFSKDEDIYHKEYPDKNVYAYINPNVTEIVIECDPDKMSVGSLICISQCKESRNQATIPLGV